MIFCCCYYYFCEDDQKVNPREFTRILNERRSSFDVFSIPISLSFNHSMYKYSCCHSIINETTFRNCCFLLLPILITSTFFISPSTTLSIIQQKKKEKSRLNLLMIVLCLIKEKKKSCITIITFCNLFLCNSLRSFFSKSCLCLEVETFDDDIIISIILLIIKKRENWLFVSQKELQQRQRHCNDWRGKLFSISLPL